ncbi:unnamed protein product [Dimorphilus gyrociliatus]|uniref:Uncharacterized protein n=1 Tax=Dimorphilus gyrociliatus TaxID=2664684 RepID=A0A7I8WFS6_9ANNE|nr:unnamed protein product [Dimorphilus gyrociliatus]
MFCQWIFIWIFQIVFCSFDDKYNPVNITLKQSTDQSTTRHSSPSSLAVNGKFSPHQVDYQVCSHTLVGINQWLLIRFERAYIIQTIRILNRYNHLNRLQQLKIGTLLNNDIAVVDIHQFQTFAFHNPVIGAARSKTFNYIDKPHYATSVILSTLRNGYMIICQVEIWNLVNIGKNQLTASNRPADNTHLAVDGECNAVYRAAGTSILCQYINLGGKLILERKASSLQYQSLR